MKKKLIVANWKLNGSMTFISNYFKFLSADLSIYAQRNNIVIAPPSVYLERVYVLIQKLNCFLGAQNIDINLTGSFTGETSVAMLKDLNVQYVIVGHSERRLFHQENNPLIAKKFSLVKSENLIPILCIGETIEEKKYGRTKNILTKQLNCIFEILGTSAFRNTVIAYEPVWAIGTGFSADAEEVQLIHQFLKNYIKKYDPDYNDVIIQYGGSINAHNAKRFIKQPDIDGLLIGSASLNYLEFLKIIEVISS
ncbi:triose-phosphate isomerase [Buchnera aphidicola (Hyadaphis tataricae)]|uniref:Triosephosphate isomerase n=1 Tax=Buchnera aphidicola (Hyadaphis tataricae) TaxID=1241859 RepID=A0A4D6XVX3_9GAMM|nr:triose-phosphate isomerase [Buchnera aphidicola]QCI21606.1 triose-phosphate isomerase [Buchnera aphidicola (Hyadaphis tataricae)]